MRSEQFDDIYFSIEDGLAESRHTYLAGNGLPDAWQGRPAFNILELGFGSGLNFLATLAAWRQTAQTGQRLHYVAVEKYPLPLATIKAGLSPWRAEIGTALDELSEVYPDVPDGTCELHLGSVSLMLCCGDIAAVLPQQTEPFDALYLDGFAPAKNPEMWSPEVCSQLARLSRTGTTLSTFTVAGLVRQNLSAAGFAVRKVPGFGRKFHMLTGVYVDAAAMRDDPVAT